MKKPKKPSKYKNEKVEFDGHKFDSKLECDYYKALRNGAAWDMIKVLKFQPVYELQPKCKRAGKSIRAITYKADFEIEYQGGDIIVYDVKGMATEAANMKRKMFEYHYQHLPLYWVSYSKMDGGWIDYDLLKAKRRERKKATEAKKA